MNNEEPSENYVSLDTLSQGAAVELFNHALQRVLENVLDVNTDPEQKREITLVVSIKPDESRMHGKVDIAVKAKLASDKGVTSIMFFGREGGVAVALERNPRQMDLPMNVTDIKKGGGNVN